jgi:hypothetical protein
MRFERRGFSFLVRAYQAPDIDIAAEGPHATRLREAT